MIREKSAGYIWTLSRCQKLSHSEINEFLALLEKHHGNLSLSVTNGILIPMELNK